MLYSPNIAYGVEILEIAGKPENEADRLEAVHSLDMMDTPPEESFDRFTRFARLLFNVPITYVSLVGDETIWFKSRQGFDTGQSPRDSFFCSHTILADDVMVIQDTISDQRSVDLPIVVNPPYVRFYAGIKLNVGDGCSVGTLSIADTRPRYPSDEEMQLLKDLARMLELEFHTQRITTTDRLTGLSNRRGFQSIALHALAMCRRMNRGASLMHIDLDNFKHVYDKYGHAEGDKVLCDISQLLLTAFRNSDVIARIGGDEFCVLLTDTNAEEIEKPLKNVTDALHEENMNLPYDISFSIGIVSFDPDRHKVIEDLMKDVDEKMALHKEEKKTAS